MIGQSRQANHVLLTVLCPGIAWTTFAEIRILCDRVVKMSPADNS
jgi:hypothetical protein